MTANGISEKIRGNGFMNRKIRQIISVMLSLICVITIWYQPVMANEKSSNYSDIDSRLKKEIKELHIPGMAIAIVNYKEVLFSETYGNCDNLDTPFIIGSLSKSFTALAVMPVSYTHLAGKAGEISLCCFLVVAVKTVPVFFKVIAVESVTVPAVVFQPVFNFIKVGINRVIAVLPGGGKVYGF